MKKRLCFDHLVRGIYLFSERHTNQNDYISDYKTLKKSLTKKYGKPKSSKSYWLNDLYKDNYQQWGMAVSKGDLTYYTHFKTDDTEIVLALSGDNYKIDLRIEYQSIKLGKLEHAEKEKKNQDKL